MSEMLIPFIEDVTPSIYKSMPGIRAQGLDVGATNNSVTLSNNAMFVNGVPTGSVFGSHFDGSAADFVGTLSPESNTGTFDTTNKKFGSASIAYNGSQFTQYADSEIWNVGGGDWYVEFWFRRNATGVRHLMFGQTDATGTNASASFVGQVTDTNVASISCSVGPTSYSATAGTVTDTNWHFFRGGRNGNQLICSLDGVVGVPVAITGSINNSTNKFSIGRSGEFTTSYHNGNIDEFLLVKNIGMNLTNFTPPNSPYSDVGYLLKSLTRLNLDRITFPKIYKPANTKCQVDVLNTVTRSNTSTGGSSTSITLDASASAVDNFYTGSTIVLTSGTGAGQVRIITNYVGSTKIATVATWTTNPASGTGFSIYPTIASSISPGYDFSQIDYSATPTVNVLCSLEKQTGATASPSMGVPIVTSIEPSWKSQTPVVSTNATTTYTTAVSINGRARLDSISSFTAAAGGIPWVRITIDGVVLATDLVVGSTTANANYVLPFNLECGSSMLIEHKSAGAFSSSVAISWSR